jgi:hypothetical protein
MKRSTNRFMTNYPLICDRIFEIDLKQYGVGLLIISEAVSATRRPLLTAAQH